MRRLFEAGREDPGLVDEVEREREAPLAAPAALGDDFAALFPLEALGLFFTGLPFGVGLFRQLSSLSSLQRLSKNRCSFCTALYSAV